MRPLSTDELQQAETRGSQNETTVSMASEGKQTIPKRPSEEDQFSASLSKSRPRSVSFNEDTIVKSYDENQATLEMPKAAETGSLKLKKEEKPIEEMSVDDMIRQAAETEDEPEDSGNNYEVSKCCKYQMIMSSKEPYTCADCQALSFEILSFECFACHNVPVYKSLVCLL